MLRTVGDQPSLWEVLLPPEVLGLSRELARVDELLDDARFFDPFRAHFDRLCVATGVRALFAVRALMTGTDDGNVVTEMFSRMFSPAVGHPNRRPPATL